MNRLFLQGVLFITTAYVIIHHAHGLCETDYIRNKTCPTTYGTPLETYTNLPSAISCARECASNNNCSSILYDHDSNICTTNTDVLTHFTTGCSTQLTYAEKTRHECSSVLSLLGQACTVPAECPTPSSSCYDSVCRCDSGYSYNPSTATCVQFCTQYGTTYQHEIGALIVGYADKTVNNVPLAECWDACVAETAFECITAEYWTTQSTCYLSVDSVSTQPMSYSVNADYDILQRDCAP